MNVGELCTNVGEASVGAAYECGEESVGAAYVRMWGRRVL